MDRNFPCWEFLAQGATQVIPGEGRETMIQMNPGTLGDGATGSQNLVHSTCITTCSLLSLLSLDMHGRREK